MTRYFDSSALVPIFVEEATSDEVRILVLGSRGMITVSDFAASEFASTMSRLVRTGKMSEPQARAFLVRFDAWRAEVAASASLERKDVAEADVLVRRFDLKLRTPDALHLATARRLGAALVTLDVRLAEAGEALGLEVVRPA